MYSADRYILDHRLYDSSIDDGAILYRVTSQAWSASDQIANGMGSFRNRNAGRFNRRQQSATYCSNNVITALSEVLYHCNRRILDEMLETEVRPHVIYDNLKQTKTLVIFSVENISNMVNLEARLARTRYSDGRSVYLGGTVNVFPDRDYRKLQEVGDNIRTDGKSGIFYSSARHYSENHCIVLFNDETSKIKSSPYEALEVEFCLVAEDFDPKNFNPSVICDPFEVKLHQTMGFYRFTDEVNFNDLVKRGLIHPNDTPVSGLVDFVRRSYNPPAKRKRSKNPAVLQL